MLRQRLITAAILLAVILPVLWYGGTIGPAALAVVVAGAGAFEILRLEPSMPGRLRLFVLTAVMLLPLGLILAGFSGCGAAVLIALALIWIAHVVIYETEQHVFQFKDTLHLSHLAVVYPGVFGSALLAVALQVQGRWILWLLLIIAANDSLAFFGGRMFGGRKMSQRISPNKTVSGLICGIVGGVTAALLLSRSSALPMSLLPAVACGVAISILGVFGDLVESLVKRAYQVKDLGTLLPGHGGVLDRADALLFAAPVLLLLKQIGLIAGIAAAVK